MIVIIINKVYSQKPKSKQMTKKKAKPFNGFNFNNLYIVVLFFALISLATSSQDLTPIQITPPPTQPSAQTTWSNITHQSAYQHLNQQLQTLDDSFTTHFLSYYHVQKSRLLQALNQQSMAADLKLENIRKNPGNYLLLLGKMYLYDVMPKSEITGYTWGMYATEARYMLAYFYLKVAAERYENPQAYYYMAVLDYYKLTPHETVIKNLEKEVAQISQEQGYDNVYPLQYNELLDHLRNQRFISVQHNLFMSSMLGHHGASLSLGNMFREGIGLDKNYKNCTTSLSYYLSVIKQTYIDVYQFRSSYSDEKNFQKELYAKRKVVFQNEQNVDVVSSSEFFDSETIKAMYQLADSYFIGKNGFRRSYVKAAELFGKLAAQDHKNSMAMLGMCYFKGQGVGLDRKRARVLFEQSSKVSISEAMLVVMDYFEMESQGTRAGAILKMKEIYEKKKQNMNPILKYLFAGLVIKGDIPSVKTDDAVLLMGGAAKEGHLMAKVSMGLLFADGIDVNYDCARAVNYFSEQAQSHPFFMDKFYTARLGLKNEFYTFSLIKYLQLSIIGDTNSFINALYILQIENQQTLNMNPNSWSIKTASQNKLYQQLVKEKIVPEIYTFFQREYSFIDNKNNLKFSTLERLFEGDQSVLSQHHSYLKKKIIKVCAVTKQNSLMNFYEYKTSPKQDASLLNTISNGSPQKLHVLQSRYLLGQHYHTRYFDSKQQGRDYTKDQYKALQQYKRATNSPILGKLLFYFEEVKLNPEGIDFSDELFEFGFVDDLLTYTFVLSVGVFVLYYKRSKKLDQIHAKELERREHEAREKRQEEERKKEGENREERNIQNKEGEWGTGFTGFTGLEGRAVGVKNMMHKQHDPSQPQIEQEERLPRGHRIGSSLQQQQQDHLVIRQYQEYKFQQQPSNNQNIEQFYTAPSRSQQNQQIGRMVREQNEKDE